MFFVEGPNLYREPVRDLQEAEAKLNEIFAASEKEGYYDNVKKEYYPIGHPLVGHLCRVSQYYGLHKWTWKITTE